jgi:hypothetical protein
MSFVCWITKAAHTQYIYYLLLFHGDSKFANAPQYYVYTYIACRIVFVFLQRLATLIHN